MGDRGHVDHQLVTNLRHQSRHPGHQFDSMLDRQQPMLGAGAQPADEAGRIQMTLPTMLSPRPVGEPVGRRQRLLGRVKVGSARTGPDLSHVRGQLSVKLLEGNPQQALVRPWVVPNKGQRATRDQSIGNEVIANVAVDPVPGLSRQARSKAAGSSSEFSNVAC